MEQYLPLAIYFLMVVGLVTAIYLVNAVLGPKPKNSQIKLEPFECGSDPIESNNKRVNVKFYLIAILFILFDIEIILLYPWAVVARSLGIEAYIKAVIFIFILTIGLVYCWRKGALEWK